MLLLKDPEIRTLAYRLNWAKPHGYIDAGERYGHLLHQWRLLVEFLNKQLDKDGQDKFFFALGGGERFGWAKAHRERLTQETQLLAHLKESEPKLRRSEPRLTLRGNYNLLV